MNQIKVAKKEQDILLNIGKIILEVNKLKDVFVTVTDVRVTNDLSWATIYVTFDEFEQQNLEKLNSAKSFIKRELAKYLNWRKIPNLKFLIDDVAKQGHAIEKILEEIRRKNK